MSRKALVTILSQANKSIARCARPYSLTSICLEKALPPRRKIAEDEITESFLKGSGPGGQKINKTSSAVQLKHMSTGIVVKCQETRSRQQNRKLARQILGEKLDEIEKGGESRTAIKTERARVKRASASKKSRRKHRKIAEEKGAVQDDGAETREEEQPEDDQHVDELSTSSSKDDGG